MPGGHKEEVDYVTEPKPPSFIFLFLWLGFTIFTSTKVGVNHLGVGLSLQNYQASVLFICGVNYYPNRNDDELDRRESFTMKSAYLYCICGLYNPE